MVRGKRQKNNQTYSTDSTLPSKYKIAPVLAWKKHAAKYLKHGSHILKRREFSIKARPIVSADELKPRYLKRNLGTTIPNLWPRVELEGKQKCQRIKKQYLL
jgi:hypothetical protein